MLKINLQFFGGRGASSGGGGEGRYSGGASLKDSDILSTKSMMSEREGDKQAVIDETLQAFSDVYDEWGMPVDDIQLAELKAGANALAYYDGANVAFNSAYFDSTVMSKAYAADVKRGFHPSNGNKTALQAVAAHELGHHLTQQIGAKQGWGNIDQSATKIVNEARKSTNHRGVVKMANAISRYASANNAECIAEALSDYYCNGKKAKAESKAIVNVLKKYK